MGVELDFLRVRKFENFFETFSTPHVSTSARKKGEEGRRYPIAFKTSWLEQDFVHKPIL